MLIDGNCVAPGTTFSARVCIVGTGMGGISVAHSLVNSGVDVIFVEVGPVKPAPGDASSVKIENIGRSFGIPRSRGLEVGGSTAFWHGVCAPLDEYDFLRRPWIPHSGWPLTRAELARYYEAAWKVLCDGDRSDCALASAALPRQPIASDLLDLKIYQFKTPPFRGKETLLRWCRQGLARCVFNTSALQLAGTPENIRTLHVGSGAGRFTVEADYFVIATGALETPRLLLNSVARTAGSYGRHSWWLGRNLMDHPVAYFSQVVFRQPILNSAFSGFRIGSAVKALPGFVLRPGQQERWKLPNHAVFVREGARPAKIDNRAFMSFLGVRGIGDVRPSHLISLVANPGILWRIVHQRLPVKTTTKYGDLFFMTEQLPNPDSRVDLSEQKRDAFGYPIARVNWRICQQDLELFDLFQRTLMDNVSGQKDVQSVRRDGIAEWADSFSSAAHHLGTARMAASAETGVVDRNLNVFGMANVWICDGSVFPTAGNVNPSLTIAALGHRLGAHLLDHLGRQDVNKLLLNAFPSAISANTDQLSEKRASTFPASFTRRAVSTSFWLKGGLANTKSNLPTTWSGSS